MPDGGFYEAKRGSPVSLGVIILLHGAAITALALAKMEMPPLVDYGSTEIFNVPITPEPPPLPPEPQPQPKELPDERITYRQPVVQLPLDNQIDVDARVTLDPPVFDPLPRSGNSDIQQPQPQPRPLPSPPVRVEAQLDPRHAERLQPDYPPSEERAGNEGRVSVRVVIGTDGRVKAVEKVSAASEAFYRATERQALRHWRFKPATLDGKPVESRKVMTVEFRIQE